MQPFALESNAEFPQLTGKLNVHVPLFGAVVYSLMEDNRLTFNHSKFSLLLNDSYEIAQSWHSYTPCYFLNLTKYKATYVA